MAADVLCMEQIHKRFGGISALRGAELALRPGEIHALIGENGSGKSTLLNILSGQLPADDGTICIDGEPVSFDSPRDALAAGVVMVTQELSLVPDLSVGENILLGHAKPRGWSGIRWRHLHTQASDLLARLGVDLDTRQRARDLRIDQQQLVEIARAISTQARIVILDEPTSSLTEDAVASLFAIMRRLRDDGVAVVFVSHKMDELFAVADRITVLRDGLTVASRGAAGYDRDTLVADMLGYPPEPAGVSLASAGSEHAVVRVESLTVPGHVADVSFDVAAGEVVGLVGLAGAGRSQLLEAMFGLRPEASGVLSDGETSAIPRSPTDAMRRGIALVPADRKEAGLVLGMSVADNLMLSATAHRRRWRCVRRSTERNATQEATASLRIVARSPQASVGSLSGGNQQKVLLSKWMSTSPRLLLLDEPTRGVDVGAKREIHRLLREARDRGLAMVVASSEVEELIALCDRFIVMFLGSVVAELTRADATEARLSHLAAGGPT